MNNLSDSFELKLSELTAIATETWRLERWLSGQFNTKATLPVRHSVRILEQLLKTHGIQILDCTGQSYDPGMAFEVLDTITLSEPTENTPLVIAETITPMILREEQMLSHGQIILQESAPVLCTDTIKEPSA